MKLLQNYPFVWTYLFGEGNPPHIGIDGVGYNGSYNVLDWIIAPENGIVIEVVSSKNYTNNNPSNYGDYGNYILIDHGNGIKTKYAHLSYGTIKVTVGQTVTKGQVLAYMGATGYTFGGHLHFEIIINGNLVNPYDYIFGNATFEPKPITLPTTHTVVSGDTVAKLCLKYYGVADQQHFDFIKKVNGLNDSYLIVLGQQLTIPIYEVSKPIEQPIENNDNNSHVEPPKEEPIEVIEDKPIEVVDPIKTSIWIELFKFIIKFIKEMFK